MKTKMILKIIIPILITGFCFFLFNTKHKKLQRIFDKEFNKQFTIVEMDEIHSPDVFHLGTGFYTLLLKDKNNIEFDGVSAGYKNGKLEYTSKQIIIEKYNMRLAQKKECDALANEITAIVAPAVIKETHIFGMEDRVETIIFLQQNSTFDDELVTYKKLKNYWISKGETGSKTFTVCKKKVDKIQLANQLGFFTQGDYKIEMMLDSEFYNGKIHVKNKEVTYKKYKYGAFEMANDEIEFVQNNNIFKPLDESVENNYQENTKLLRSILDNKNTDTALITPLNNILKDKSIRYYKDKNFSDITAFYFQYDQSTLMLTFYAIGNNQLVAQPINIPLQKEKINWKEVPQDKNDNDYIQMQQNVFTQWFIYWYANLKLSNSNKSNIPISFNTYLFNINENQSLIIETNTIIENDPNIEMIQKEK
jgi:hypothetical protein